MKMQFKRLSMSSISLRGWIGITVALMVLMIWFVLTLFHMAPDIVVLPQLFSPDIMRFNQFIEATNLNAQAQVKEHFLIDEMMIRFYIENRHFYVPDGAELAYRYGGRGPVARLSSPQIYQTFLAEKGPYLESVQNATGSSVVDITAVSRRDNTFTVDFDQYIQEGMQVRFAGSYRATAKIAYSAAHQNFSSDFINPFGMVVVSYDETILKKR